MHIAVCMDVAPDRKQLERLLGRSTDARIALDPSVPYYIQSYGNKEALLARPFMYDMFFIDLVNDDVTSVELIRKLRNLGVTATIVMCPSRVDLSGELTPEDNVLILKQPIQKDRLEYVLDRALAANTERKPKLDIRGKHKTDLVYEEDFLYAEKTGEMMIEAHLSDGRVIQCFETLDSLARRCDKFGKIVCMSGNLIANKDYVASTGFGSLELKDGKKFRVTHKVVREIKS
ncbi:DNA-binding response regulator, LytR/AlgR family [Lachnospiraceae bacterium XBB2008]|nr:DNA-binding response regulator, LytR/AlgR family [Lachnospiraceae bacterium XBB2008]